jgi:hypothetical protein
MSLSLSLIAHNLGGRVQGNKVVEADDTHARNSVTGEVLQLDELAQSGRNYLLFSADDAKL